MLFRHTYQGGVWIDIEQPTEDDIRQVTREFSITERFERELLSPTPTTLATSEGNMALLVLHFPAPGTADGVTENQEVDFIVGSDFILTVRYEVVAPLHHLQKLLETQKLVSEKVDLTVEVLLEILFAHLYASVHDHTNHTVSHLTRIERDMFDGNERTTILSILQVSREFLHMETALADQEEPLSRFLTELTEHDFFGTTFLERGERIRAERAQIERLVEIHRVIATELRETNIALLEARQNEIMKTLTTVNFIFLPLGLVAWIFAMRTEGIPFIDSPNAFWIVLGIMLGVAMLLTGFFIKKRWL